MKTLIIRSSEWLRGEGGATSTLYAPGSERMCCLGILGIACGFPKSALEYNGHPGDVEEIGFIDGTSPDWPFDWNEEKDSESISRAILINDQPGDKVSLTTKEEIELGPIDNDEARIEMLRPIFRGWGYEIDWRPGE